MYGAMVVIKLVCVCVWGGGGLYRRSFPTTPPAFTWNGLANIIGIEYLC